jgi:O-antigen/teichoic acid export membrane protein
VEGNSTRKFIRDVFFSNLPTPFQKVRTYLWLAVFARRLGPEGYGAWSLFNVTLGVATSIASLNMGNAMMRFLSGARSPGEINRAVSTVLSAIAVCATALALLSAALSPWGAVTLFHSRSARTLILLMALALPFDCLFEGVKSYLRARRLNSRWAALVMGRLLPETAGTVLVGALLLSVNAVAATYVLCAAASAIAAIYYLFHVRGVKFVLPSVTILKRYASFGLPLLPGALTYFLAVNASRDEAGWNL